MTQAYWTNGADRAGRWLITCDHATNRVPDWVAQGDLGLPAADMERHIAYDIGAAGLADALAVALNSPAVFSNFSRLVIDPNRGEDDPTVLMKLYDGTIIAGNRDADAAEKEQRLDRLHRPYHTAIAGMMRPDTVYCAVHSFTPQLRGRTPRPWQVGLLYPKGDAALSHAVIAGCRDAGWTVGDNEPYVGYLPGDAVDRHATAAGVPNILIEVRQDLIADAAGQTLWAQALAPILSQALADTGL